jgi:ariadne-1
MAKAGDESENVKWLIANTKRCPECSKPIEKNGGCMHMTCGKASGGCGHEFCWLCRGPWSAHGAETGGYYACNKYDASKAKEEDTKASSVKTELAEYMFYYHRYESHGDAMKIADHQRKQAQMKASEVMDLFKVRAQDTNFLTEATEQLLANRKVLRWSYVYGFYLNKGDSQERQLFEYLQEDLEKHTDKLSHLYEQPLEKINDYHEFMKYKEEVTNYTRVTAGFLKKFVEGVMGGLTDV